MTSRTHTYPGEVGPWPAYELAEPILHASRITGDYAANRDATCDDGSDHYLAPEWVFYEAVLRNEGTL